MTRSSRSRGEVDAARGTLWSRHARAPRADPAHVDPWAPSAPVDLDDDAVESERIAPDTFLPRAANLLPESEQLRTLKQLLGMAAGDVIGLLSAIGGAGALSIGHPGRTATVQWRPVGKPEDLERIIEELPNKPFLVGDEGVSMSLAGVQTKLAVAIDDAGRVCIPMNGSPSTHILKPDAPRLRGGVQNEAFCLTLARRMGIPTPDVTTGQADKRSYLLMKRYDRTNVGGRWRRLHQEDYCRRP